MVFEILKSHKILANVFALFIIFFAFSACSDDDETKEAELIGKWQLIEMYSDPGDGSGTFMPVNSNKTIEFKSDKTFLSNGTLCHLSLESNSPSSGTFSETNKTIIPAGCELFADLPYEIESNELTIYFFCIEGCGEKYKKID